MSQTEVTAYNEFRAKINEVKDSCYFLPDVSVEEGYKKSKRVALDVGKILTALDAKRKELKADSLAYGRKIDAEAAGIREELEGYQLPHKQAYKELDGMKKQREAERKADLERRLDEMAGLPDAMRDSSSDGVKMALESLHMEECEDFYEYTMQALKARNESKKILSALFHQKLKEEQDAVELAALRKEQVARDAVAIAEKVEQDKADAVRGAEEKATRELEKAQQAEQASKSKREADKEHMARINNAAMAELCSIAGTSQETARAVITAIAKNTIPNMSINY